MAVREGFHVTTLDAFADSDTRSVAQSSHMLKLQDGVIDMEVFQSQVAAFNLSQFDAVLYGSVFDNAPHCLRWLEQHVAVKGNRAETLAAVQDKPRFFTSLQQLGIPFPHTVYDAVSASVNEGWLVKRSQACGGAHIQKWCGEVVPTGAYLQRQIPGMPVSLLFYANGESACKIGFNRLLVRDAAEFPFQFAGAVSRYVMPDAAAKVLLDAAQKLTRHYWLQGMNSLDAILTDEGVWILELNPRLSASASLYPAMPLIRMQLDLQADGFFSGGPGDLPSCSEMIVFADKDIVIPESMRYPAWVADIPVAGQTIPKHNPVCSVLAQADTPDAALALLMQRYNQLKIQLKTCLEP